MSDTSRRFAEAQRRIRQAMKDHGWAGIGIYDDPRWPGYTYSAGIWKTSRRPEVILFGVPHETALQIIGNVYRKAKGKPPLALGTPIEGMIGGFPCYLFSVSKSKYEGLISVARSVHGGDEFPCVQIVYPDAAGFCPWDDRCDPTVRGLQPDLTESGWRAELTE